MLKTITAEVSGMLTLILTIAAVIMMLRVCLLSRGRSNCCTVLLPVLSDT